MKALKEKHETEIDDVFRSIDSKNLDTDDKRAVYRHALIQSVDISKVNEQDKRKALE